MISGVAPIFGAIVAVSTLVPPARADIISDRQADMKAMAAAAKAIAEMFRNPDTYSSKQFAAAAGAIAERSGEILAGHFTDGVEDARSEAKPDIIEERDRFDRLAEDLRVYARALDAQAQANPGAMTDRMRMRPGEPMGGGPLGTQVTNAASLSSLPAEHIFHLMLQTCTTCHARFRMER
ncbi:cytochrome c [Rhizobium sp. BK456]|uniref:cytochrome c n=1 Tax=Rhizobium sp. BK456 TaxID=2587007 RepID=UPI00161B8B7E|nr:cytochrome c [Rhizobium sp. BK456]